jgi:hypothetical protein
MHVVLLSTSLKGVVDLQRVDTAIEDVILDAHSAVFDSVAKNSDQKLSSSRYLVDAVWRSLIENRSGSHLPAKEDLRTLYLALVGQHSMGPERRNTQLDFCPFTDSVLPNPPTDASSFPRRDSLDWAPPTVSRATLYSIWV